MQGAGELRACANTKMVNTAYLLSQLPPDSKTAERTCHKVHDREPASMSVAIQQ